MFSFQRILAAGVLGAVGLGVFPAAAAAGPHDQSGGHGYASHGGGYVVQRYYDRPIHHAASVRRYNLHLDYNYARPAHYDDDRPDYSHHDSEVRYFRAHAGEDYRYYERH